MPLTLPSSIIGLKNALAGDQSFVMLAEVQVNNIDIPETLRFARNTENVTWDGETWVAFPFDLDMMGDTSRGEVPKMNLKVSNVSRAVQSYIEQADGGIDAPVALRLIHETQFSTSEYCIRLDFVVSSTSCNSQWVNFELSGSNPWTRRVPATRCRKNFCRWRFKSYTCGYHGVGTTCDKTLSQCKTYLNSDRYGAFPGVGATAGVRV